MDVGAEFRRCLEDLDVAGVRKLWAHISPNLPAPKSDAEALTTLHMARTAAESMPLKLRAYSHRWLLDRGLPSQLPDPLKPKAERLYPRVIEAVGISVNFSSPLLKPAEALIRTSMEDAVNDVFADDPHPDPALVSARMAEARERETKALFGRMGAR